MIDFRRWLFVAGVVCIVLLTVWFACADSVGYKYVGLSGVSHRSNLTYVTFDTPAKEVLTNLENYTINVTTPNSSMDARYDSLIINSSLFARPKQYFNDTSFRVIKKDTVRVVNYNYRANQFSAAAPKKYAGFESMQYIGQSSQVLNDVHNQHEPYVSRYNAVLVSVGANDANFNLQLSSLRKQTGVHTDLYTGTYDYGYKGTEQRTGRIG